MTSFAQKYGPWALVAGASEGVGAAFAAELARRGCNVVLLARRQAVLDEVAATISSTSGVETRTLAVDLAHPDAVATIVAGIADLEIGFLVYCAGADPDFRPFLDNGIEAADAMVHRNCVVPMRLCHELAPAMVGRGRGGIVLLGSGAGFAGAPNMAAYSATKAFGMVFAEALWAELHDSGIDVLGLILGKTDTPALRRLEHSRGTIASPDQPPADATTVDEVVADAFGNLTDGPTRIVGEQMRAAIQMMGSITRNQAVQFIAAASAAAMGPGSHS